MASAFRTGKWKVSKMRRFLAMTVVIGTGAIGFAAASQAGISLRPPQILRTGALEDSLANKHAIQTCRIEKSLKYDFNGNPYMKKVRICA